MIDSLKSSSEGGGGGGERGLEAALDEMRSEKYQLQSQLINNEQVILSLRTELQVEREMGGGKLEKAYKIQQYFNFSSLLLLC